MTKINHITVKESEEVTGQELHNTHINMSNTLIKAAHSLNLIEKRTIAACIAKLDSSRISQTDQYTKIKLTALDYAETYDVELNHAYEELKKAADNLFERYIRVIEDTPKGRKEIKFRWISSATYQTGDGWIELSFTPEVAPHLAVLRGKYKGYKLKQASGLRSSYSWRLLELLDKYKAVGLLSISLQEFRHAMDAPEKYRYNEIRRWIIEPAVSELVEKDNLCIEWKGIRKGRSIETLEFTINENPQQNLIF